MINAATEEHVFSVVGFCGGGGGGVHGFQKAEGRLFDTRGTFRVIGGYDHDRYACDIFKYLTGVDQACVDMKDLTPQKMRDLFGVEAPDLGIGSFPCQGSSLMISDELAATTKYKEMNELIVLGTELVLDAWSSRPPPFLLYENVPAVTSPKRAGPYIAKVASLLKKNEYAQIAGIHNARIVGGGAQERLRWFSVARHLPQVPWFLYQPPESQNQQVIGDVFGGLPYPGDPAAGPMHRLAEKQSFLNDLRLWAVRAGKDWNDLKDGKWRSLVPQSGNPGMHANKYTVKAFSDVASAVITATRIGSGAPGVAQPIKLEASARRGRGGVIPDDGVAGAVTSNARANTGRFGRAAPVPLVPEKAPFGGAWGVTAIDETVGAVTTRSGNPSTSRSSYAAPVPLVPTTDRRNVVYGVKAIDESAGAVTTQSGNPSTGDAAYAAPIPGDPVNLIPIKECFPSAYGVLDTPRAICGTVKTKSTVGNGAYARTSGVPAGAPVNLCVMSRGRKSEPHGGAYEVRPANGTAKTVAACAGIDNSPVAVADHWSRPPFVVLSYDETLRIVDGDVSVPFVIVDPEDPEGEPLAIVDDLARPAYRMETYEAKPGRFVRRAVTVHVVLVSADGTWHRAMTTLELALLQGFPAIHRGAPLNFGGGSTKMREVIGNAIPVHVTQAMGGQISLCLLAARTGRFMLSGDDRKVWVAKIEAAGVQVMGPKDRFRILDDGTVKLLTPRKGKKAKRQARSTPRHHAAVTGAAGARGDH